MLLGKFALGIGSALITLVILLGIYLLSSVALSRIPARYEPGSSGDITVFILTNGVHTDLVVPVRPPQMNWLEIIMAESNFGTDSGLQYAAFGWGNREFYLKTPAWEDLKFTTAIKAVIGFGPSAIHLTFHPDLTEGEDCKRITLNGEQFYRLSKYIQKCFATDENGNYQKISTGTLYGQGELFYEATGRFSLFFTCNTWANSGLKACGQKACVWTPFKNGIFRQYHSY